jgi:hypothetical protein
MPIIEDMKYVSVQICAVSYTRVFVCVCMCVCVCVCVCVCAFLRGVSCVVCASVVCSVGVYDACL